MSKTKRGKPDYTAAVHARRMSNVRDVLGLLEAEDKDFMKKVANFSARWEKPMEEVIERIRNDEMFRMTFAKDPSKQGMHEDIAADFIETLSGVENFEQLPKNKFVILRGGVYEKKDVQKRGSSTPGKTLDFSWEFCGKQAYASHKHTTSSGGGQDNQRKDLEAFITEANESTSQNVYFFAIADGDYYQSKDKNGESWMDRFKNHANNRRNVYALPIDELEDKLREICGK